MGGRTWRTGLALPKVFQLRGFWIENPPGRVFRERLGGVDEEYNIMTKTIYDAKNHLSSW